MISFATSTAPELHVVADVLRPPIIVPRPSARSETQAIGDVAGVADRATLAG